MNWSTVFQAWAVALFIAAGAFALGGVGWAVGEESPRPAVIGISVGLLLAILGGVAVGAAS